MGVLLRSLGQGIVYLFTHHKLFLAFLFILTAGQEFPLPEWLDITIGLAMMFTVVVWWLGQV